ncbi:MAG: hypothetical protein ACFFBD_08110 [Candidatus Hodarchaeota archaeon]
MVQLKDISPTILSFLTQEEKNLSEEVLCQLLELINLDEIQPSALEPLRPLLLSLLLSVTSSKMTLQAKKKSKLLEEEK